MKAGLRARDPVRRGPLWRRRVLEPWRPDAAEHDPRLRPLGETVREIDWTPGHEATLRTEAPGADTTAAPLTRAA